jgi:hypothetical protein
MTRTASGLLVPTLVVSLLLIHPAAGAARPQMLEQVVEAGGGRTAVHLRILGGCEGQAIGPSAFQNREALTSSRVCGLGSGRSPRAVTAGPASDEHWVERLRRKSWARKKSFDHHHRARIIGASLQTD